MLNVIGDELRPEAILELEDAPGLPGFDLGHTTHGQKG